jgi:uncharacterized membrane protein YhaH (DUF805 family)
MKFSLMKSIMILVVISSIAICPTALAQEWVGLQNNMVEITYVPPSKPENKSIYELLKNRQVLEELSALLSPLQLPTKISAKMVECGATNLFYAPGEGLILCYEFPVYLAHMASGMTPPQGLTRRDLVVGTFVQAVLHEVGHAVFDMLQVPVFGRQDDAADQIAAFVMLNFGKDFARRNLLGVAYFMRAVNRPVPRSAFADDHGTFAQRYYNMLCIAYGGQPDTFKDLVQTGTLPEERASHCGHEYDQVKFAFTSTVWPHVDQDQLKKVQSIEWAKWEGDINAASRLLPFLGSVIIWSAIVVLLARAMSTSATEFIREMMTFGLKSFEGRLDRIHWWAYMLTASLVAFVLNYALASLEVDFASPRPLRLVHAVLIWAILVLLYYCYTVFVIKRLHDRNKHGWLVVFWLAPMILVAMIVAYPDFGVSPFFVWSYVLSFFLWVWIFIELGFRRGTRGENLYGPETRYSTIGTALAA